MRRIGQDYPTLLSCLILRILVDLVAGGVIIRGLSFTLPDGLATHAYMHQRKSTGYIALRKTTIMPCPPPFYAY